MQRKGALMEDVHDLPWPAGRSRAPRFLYPDAVAGHSAIVVTDTLEAVCWFTRSERLAWERAWIGYFESSGAFELKSLWVESNVRQPLFDAMRPLHGLERLSVETGTYSDLEPLGGTPRLREASLDCRKVRDVAPLVALQNLHSLRLYGAGRVENIDSLGSLVSLRTLDFDWLPGSKLQVNPTSFDWVAPLQRLESLRLPGANIEADLAPLAELPRLRELVIPLRREYRDQVESLARTHAAFAGVARAYAERDQYVAGISGRCIG